MPVSLPRVIAHSRRVQNVRGMGTAACSTCATMGLMVGSITGSAGHGTGAAYADSSPPDYNLAGALPIAMAAGDLRLVWAG